MKDSLRELRARIPAARAIEARDADVAKLLAEIGMVRAYHLANGRSRHPPTKIYFLQHRVERAYKIGTTSMLFARKRAIETEFAWDRDILRGQTRLAVAAWGTYQHERELHERFAHLRMTSRLFLSKEWFHSSPELVKYMASLIADDVGWIPEEA